MMEATDISPRIGTRVSIDKADLVNGAHAAELDRLMKERGALVFPQMHLSKEEQLAFARTLGDVVPLGEEGLSKISLDPKVSATADYTRGAFFWHIDGANDDIPAKATMLTAMVLSDEGTGDTMIANTYAAYDDLPEEDKQLVEGVRVFHSLEASQRMVHPEPSYDLLLRWQAYPSRTHPLVWKHRSGRKSLLLGASALYVKDMDLQEGNRLLCRLREWASQPQYVYRHQWTVGDLLVWDNTGTMHCAADYALDSKRLMHRTTLHGEEPIA
jgi:alpha-ketoglutarate-dependent taurine dioxygenase